MTDECCKPLSRLTASEVATYLTGSLGVPASKLQPLLYYTQAWYLVLHDEKLFNDEIEAGDSGAVVPFPTGGSPCAILDLLIQTHLTNVVRRYKSKTGDQLNESIRHEAPWIVARNRIAVNGKKLIRGSEMTLFYRYPSRDILIRAVYFTCTAWEGFKNLFRLNVVIGL
jgi:uncharacterized phage-associated protein